jgi:Cathepsin propeptide inhibitor domain (I29)
VTSRSIESHFFHSTPQYSSTEDKAKRYGIFKNSLIDIDANNIHERSTNGSAIYGVTNFADLSKDEFRATFLGTKAPAGYHTQRRLMKIAPAVSRPMKLTAVDWTGAYTTPIKYQGGCGSCW